MKKWLSGCLSVIVPGLFLCQKSYAQLTIGAQLRTRAELRDGQSNPQPANAPAAFFISQRTRVFTTFKAPRLQLGLTLQDVRIWGQDASTINKFTAPQNNGVMLHEAWAMIGLTDTSHTSHQLLLQIGRQELRYDDERLLGNLDWLQQGRRHDALVLKYTHHSWTTHLGAAFNQNKENASGTVYNPTPPDNYPANTNNSGMYKSMEYLYVKRQFARSYLSFLLLADQFSRYHIDTIESKATKVWENKTDGRITSGLFYTAEQSQFQYTLAAYYQKGNNVDGYLLSGSMVMNLPARLGIGAGADLTSPDFDPLYGTPHKFWGSMDYFYAASGFGNKGLQDYYLKAIFKPNAKHTASAVAHEFFSASAIPSYTKRFGTELDLTYGYALTPMIGIEAGYSHFWNTNTLTSATVKNVPNASSNSNWAYLSIQLRPQAVIK